MLPFLHTCACTLLHTFFHNGKFCFWLRQLLDFFCLGSVVLWLSRGGVINKFFQVIYDKPFIIMWSSLFFGGRQKKLGGRFFFLFNSECCTACLSYFPSLERGDQLHIRQFCRKSAKIVENLNFATTKQREIFLGCEAAPICCFVHAFHSCVKKNLRSLLGKVGGWYLVCWMDSQI